jgi:predicted ArsR family transcriptional regulator
VTRQDVPEVWRHRILDLLDEEGPLSMSAISARLGKNPGGVRQRLILMKAQGKVVEIAGPLGRLWGLPGTGDAAESKEADIETRSG